MLSLRTVLIALLGLGVLCSAPLLYGGELNPNYLEGRLVAGSAHDLHLSPWRSPQPSPYQAVASDLWRSGSEGEGMESRLLLQGATRYDEPHWSLGLLGWEGEIRPVEEAFVRWNWTLANSWLAFHGKGDRWSHGFEADQSLELRQWISFGYLQRLGRIRVEQPVYPVLFYRNPIVNRGQHRLGISESHAFASAGILADSLNVEWRYGLTRFLEFGAKLVNGRDVVLRDKWDDSPWVNKTELQLTTLTGPLRTEWISEIPLWTSNAGEAKEQQIGLAADLVLFGARRLFSEVTGNWNGFFDRTALPGQLLLSARADSWSMGQPLKNGPDSLRVSGLLGLPWGIALDGGALQTESWSWGIGLSWLAMPLRTGGPERASAMEVLYGLIPPPGGHFLHLDLWNDQQLYGSFNWLIGLFSRGFFVAKGGWDVDGNGPAFWGSSIGIGNRHWRVQLGGQYRWSDNQSATTPSWRIDRNRQQVESLYSRTVGEPPLQQKGWSVELAWRSWF